MLRSIEYANSGIICDIQCQRYLRYCEILTDSSIPEVVFYIQTHSEAQHAGRSVPKSISVNHRNLQMTVFTF